jgi:diguanylate cyclase (GGDEF)-like protein/PAS domain S-box-containing protein
MSAVLSSFEAIHEVIANFPAFICVLDRKGVFQVSEGGALAALGRTAGEVVGQNIADYYRERPDILALIDRAQSGETVRAPFTLRGRVYDVQHAPLRDPAGAIVGVLGLGIDITAQHEAEEAYRSLFDGASEGVFRSAFDGGRIMANPALARILGYDSPAHLLAEVSDLAAQLYTDPVQRQVALDRLRWEGALSGHEIAARRRDGSTAWLVISARLVRDAAGVPVAIEGRAEDITLRRELADSLAESEAHQRATLNALHDGVVRQERDGRITACNPAAERILGLSAGELEGRTSSDLRWRAVHEDGSPYPGEEHPSMRALATGWPQRDEIMGIHRLDGTLTWLAVNATPLLRPNEIVPYAVVTSFADITARKVAEDALRASEARLQDFLDNASDLIQMVDRTGRFVYVNRAWSAALGYGAEEVRGMHLSEIIRPDMLEAGRALFARVLAGGGSEVLESVVVARDGREIAVSGYMDLRAEPGQAPLLRGIFRDITAQRALEARLLHDSHHDALTGLPNRAHFLERLEGALARGARRGEAVALLFLDLDGFKAVNDRLGHAAGDLLLITIGARLRDCLRAGDTVARLGGDEFTILLEDSPVEAELAALAARVIATVGGPVFLGQAVGQVSASIGIAQSGPELGDPQALLAAADLAMYRAKAAGRSRWSFATVEPGEGRAATE